MYACAHDVYIVCVAAVSFPVCLVSAQRGRTAMAKEEACSNLPPGSSGPPVRAARKSKPKPAPTAKVVQDELPAKEAEDELPAVEAEVKVKEEELVPNPSAASSGGREFVTMVNHFMLQMQEMQQEQQQQSPREDELAPEPGPWPGSPLSVASPDQEPEEEDVSMGEGFKCHSDKYDFMYVLCVDWNEPVGALEEWCIERSKLFNTC